MTRAELRRRVLQALNDDTTSPVFWSTAEIDTLLDEGQEVLAEQTPAFTRTFTVPLRNGTALYRLGGVGERIMTPTRLWLPGEHRRLEAVTLSDLDARHEEWLTVTGTPWCWAPVDWETFTIWPAPATGGGILDVTCYVWPVPLQSDADRPELPEADQEALVLYAEADGHAKQWDVARGTDVYKAFLARAVQSRNTNVAGQFRARHWVRGEA